MISPIGETKVNSAFTLVEILLVLIIAGIILALAAPGFSKGYSSFQLNQTADDLMSMSRWAQAMAIGQERIYALIFSDDRHSYSLVRTKVSLADQATGNIETNDQNNFEPVNGTLGRLHSIPSAIRLDVQEDRIEFYPDGTIDPASIQLNSSDKKIVLSSMAVRGMMTKVNDD